MKWRALKATGEFQDRSLEREITECLRHADAEVRFCRSVVWDVARISNRSAGIARDCRVRVESCSRRGELGRAPHGFGRRRVMAKTTGLQSKAFPAAMLVAGVVGDPVFVPWLVSLMGQLPLARLAGESFTMITGVDLAYRDLERKPPQDFNAGPTEDPKDENIEMDPDDNLPWPEPALVQKWWDKNRSQFQNGTRYLLGKTDKH